MMVRNREVGFVEIRRDPEVRGRGGIEWGVKLIRM